MILSRDQIEAIGETIVMDFEQHSDTARLMGEYYGLSAIPIERFAADYLGLEVSMAKLSEDGSICGLTAYTDTMCQIPDGKITRIFSLHSKQVLLDNSLAGPLQTGRRRFTLAHECAHQILFSLENETSKKVRTIAYSKRASYSLRELKTKEDWNEWQANALAAAILIPIGKLKRARCRMAQTRPVKCYGTKLDPDGNADVTVLCDEFSVSRTAMLIRLRQIGAVIDRPISEYWNNSLEIWQ